jgi:hypothetical protein
MLTELPVQQRANLGNLDLHVFIGTRDKASLVYELDDGESLAYKRGAHRRYKLDVECKGRTLALSVQEELGKRGASLQPLQVRLVTYGAFDAVLTPNGEEIPLEPCSVRWTGAEIAARCSATIKLGS